MREVGGGPGGGGICPPSTFRGKLFIGQEVFHFSGKLETCSEFRTPGFLEYFRDLLGNERKYQKIIWKFDITQKCIRIFAWTRWGRLRATHAP